MDKIYIELRWHDSREAKRHLDHVTRKRSRIENPKVEKLGDVPERYFLVKPAGRTKPITNRYLEIMTYVRTKDEALRVKDYLDYWLKRKTNVYLHDDEGGRHAHFILRNADDNDRALRLAKDDLREIKKDIAFALGRQLSPRGTGRRRLALKELKADPEALESAKREFEGTIAQIDELMTLYADYQRIRIAYRSGKGTRVVQDIDPRRSVRDQLLYRRLKAFEADGFEVLFAPVPQPAARVVYLDRVPEGRLGDLPAGTIVVETPGNGYETHTPVTLPLSVSWVARAQRVLCSMYEANRASVDPESYRRLTGFRNMGRQDSHEVRVREDILCRGRALSIRALKADLTRQKRIQDAAGELVKHILAGRAWGSFWDANREKADLEYAGYLAEQGCNPDEIRNAVLAQSEDIVIRKGTGMGRYLDHLVRRAGEHVGEILKAG
jgi:hypothetical protein